MSLTIRLAGLLLGSCLALGAGGAAAQGIIPNAAERLSTRDISPADRARDTMNRYAECLVKMRGVAVRRALSQPSDAQIDSALAGVASSDCLYEGELTMQVRLFRGALYRATYLREFGDQAAPAALSAGLAPSSDPLRAFGDCVVRQAPADARALVVSDPATTAEREAIAGLGPALSNCVAAGDQVPLSKSVLQGTLAEALYRHVAGQSPGRDGSGAVQ